MKIPTHPEPSTFKTHKKFKFQTICINPYITLLIYGITQFIGPSKLPNSITITHSKFNDTISTAEKLKLLLPHSCQLSQITKHLQQSDKL
jgi:hypothetical protein